MIDKTHEGALREQNDCGRVFLLIVTVAFCWACVWVVGIFLAGVSVVGILLGVCLGRWHFAGSGFGSLTFCRECIWVVGILCLGRWHFSGRVFGSLTSCLACFWVVGILMGGV